MYKGRVKWYATVLGSPFQLPTVECMPSDAPGGIDCLILEFDGGRQIVCTTQFKSVGSWEEALAVGRSLADGAVNRLAFRYDVAISELMSPTHDLEPINPPSGFRVASMLGSGFTLFLHGEPENDADVPELATAKIEIERPSTGGERYIGMFRSALLSSSHVEKYMHLYNLLLTICGDDFKAVDDFIKDEEKTVPYEATHPSKNPKKPNTFETFYTRLRNEFAHDRVGVGANMDKTKADMDTHWMALRDLVKTRIKQFPP